MLEIIESEDRKRWDIEGQAPLTAGRFSGTEERDTRPILSIHKGCAQEAAWLAGPSHSSGFQ